MKHKFNSHLRLGICAATGQLQQHLMIKIKRSANTNDTQISTETLFDGQKL